MSVEENKAKLRRVYEDCFNHGNLATADEIVSPQGEEISPTLPPGVPRGGPATLKAVVQMIRAGYPDLHVTVDELVGEGDTVASRTTWTGTHRGELMGIPPTGKSVTWQSTDFVIVKDGKFVRHWGIQDQLGMMQQLGVIPSPQGAPA